MRIVSWNCCMAYRRKHHLVEPLQPDILILQEVSERDLAALDATSVHWVGGWTHKGLAVASFGSGKVTLDPSYTPGLPWFLPVQVGDLRILACWACVLTPSRSYVRLVHEAIAHYRAFLTSGPAIVIGDLNSNGIFDRRYRKDNHAGLVEVLRELGLHSLYHHATGEAHGEERMPTYFHMRNRARPYHFDYAFVPESMLGAARLAIGEPGTWFGPSDHLPLIVDLGT